MKLLTDTFNEIKQKLVAANIGIKMIDVWNNQTNNINTETIVTPTVYVELTDFAFTPHQYALQTESLVRIHIVQHQFKTIVDMSIGYSTRRDGGYIAR